MSITSSPLDGESETTPEDSGGGASDRKLKIYELWIAGIGVGGTLLLGFLTYYKG